MTTRKEALTCGQGFEGSRVWQEGEEVRDGSDVRSSVSFRRSRGVVEECAQSGLVEKTGLKTPVVAYHS